MKRKFVLFLCRYLVDCRWFKQWKKFVGFDTWDQFGVGDQANNPGPLDNSSLFSGIYMFMKIYR